MRERLINREMAESGKKKESKTEIGRGNKVVKDTERKADGGRKKERSRQRG